MRARQKCRPPPHSGPGPRSRHWARWVAARSESSGVSGAVKPASAEAQLNPSIDSASAQPRERVEVLLLQLLGVGSVSIAIIRRSCSDSVLTASQMD